MVMFDKILYFEYDIDENRFYDQYFQPVHNMLLYITANDLYLFRHDPGRSMFAHRFEKRVMCEIDIRE